MMINKRGQKLSTQRGNRRRFFTRIQEHARIRARANSRETVSPLRQSPRIRLTKSKLCADGRPAQLKASNSGIRARTRARVF
jgi:hypothetical protein